MCVVRALLAAGLTTGLVLATFVPATAQDVAQQEAPGSSSSLAPGGIEEPAIEPGGGEEPVDDQTVIAPAPADQAMENNGGSARNRVIVAVLVVVAIAGGIALALAITRPQTKRPLSR